MIKYIKTGNPADCCGCRACEQICVHKAIEFKLDKEGFYYPEIDTEKCVDCGLCEKVCPMYKAESIIEKKGKAYAFQLSEKQHLLNSSSGGAFYAIASIIIKNKGVVYGAAFRDKYVYQTRVDNISDLTKLMGSKYVQSDTNDTYSQVKKDLKDNKLVYYSGTPCQIAGLRLFLRRSYDNLITTDLICHGTPSPKILADTLSRIEHRYKGKIVKCSFRDKKVGGWACSSSSSSIARENGQIKYVKHCVEQEAYFKAFISGHLMRMSCYQCPFACTNRVGDITIADYWGVKRLHPEFPNISQGMSLLVVSTDKGKQMLEAMSESNFVKEVNFEQAAAANHNLMNSTPYTDARKNSYRLFNEDYYSFKKKYYKGNVLKNTIKAEIIYFIRSNNWVLKLVSKLVHLKK